MTDPEELLQLHSKLEALVQLHLLRLLGIKHDHISHMATRFPPLRKKLGGGRIVAGRDGRCQ